MLIASFAGAGTLLGVGEQVVGNRERGHSFGQDSHEQLVQAAHECNGSKIGRIGDGFFFMNQDGGCSLPCWTWFGVWRQVLQG